MLNSIHSYTDRKSKKRVGRGIGSGKGKTAGKGCKGQKARSGVSLCGFEGGQTPIYRRIPKRGFVSTSLDEKKETLVVNLQFLSAIVEKYKPQHVDLAFMRSIGVAQKYHKKFKILAKGKLDAKLDLTCDFITEAAANSLSASGVKLTVGNQ